MKTYLLISILFVVGCDSLRYNDNQFVFYTQDSLYKIALNIPSEMDTFYSWMDEDDNACDTDHKYRFSKSSFPIHKESGFFDTTLVDSAYQVTFSHIENYFCKGISNFNQVKAQGLLYKSTDFAKSNLSNIDTHFAKDLMISGKIFKIWAYITRDSIRKYYIHALTEVDSNLIAIEGKCQAKSCDKFIDKIMTSINTIQIETSK